MPFSKKNLSDLVGLAIKHKASDIHIRSGECPCFRIRGGLVPVQTKAFESDDIKDICHIILEGQDVLNDLDKLNDLDGAYEINDLCRLRFNFFRYNNKAALIFRIINSVIPTIDQLNLSPVIKKIAMQERGLVLVTGATGSGKSTTLAAMINHINQNKHCHIISIEDPIEYIHPQIKSRISQREVGKDTKDFSQALKMALRQDPDIILIGEMRDPETVSIALKAAETGHVVFSTAHTTDALNTIGRIIAMYPPSEQEAVKKRLSESLQASIGQRMLKGVNPGEIIIAQEIMISGPGVKECILGQEPLHKIYQIIQNGRGEGGNGSQSFDQHIQELFEKNLISKEVALTAVRSQSDFLKQMIMT
jgi:twitching motility protein PilT